VEVAQLVERDGQVALQVGPRRLGLGQALADPERLLVPRAGLGAVAEVAVEVAQLVERDGQVALQVGPRRLGLGQV
jgi:hypothetical protein